MAAAHVRPRAPCRIVVTGRARADASGMQMPAHRLHRAKRMHCRLTLIASAIVVLNLLDASFTLAYTTSGLATEANPVMDTALAVGPLAFMVAKLVMVSLAVLFLVRVRHHRAAAVGLVGAGATYTSLLLYHLSAMPALLALHS